MFFLRVLVVYLPLIVLVWLPIALYSYCLHCDSYWRKRKIPFIPSKPIVGSLMDLFLCRKCPAELFEDFYNHRVAMDKPFVGIHYFNKAAVVVRDLDLVKMILVKDFASFKDRYATSDIHSDILGATNLFLIPNPAWKVIRSRMTPFFTGVKLKQMFHLMKNVGNEMNDTLMLLSAEVNEKTNSFCADIKDLFARYTTDVIGSCAFGIEANSLKNPESEFRKNGKRIFDFHWYRALEISSVFFIPEIVSFFKFKDLTARSRGKLNVYAWTLSGFSAFIYGSIDFTIIIKGRSDTNQNEFWLFFIQEVKIGNSTKSEVFSKATTAFFRKSINDIMDERKKSGSVRNDLIDTLINLEKEDTFERLSVNNIVFQGDVIVAQAAIFFSGAFETSSYLMTFALYELCLHIDLQTRLRKEIKDTLLALNGEFNYDNVNGMVYLNMVLLETLRMYPPLPFLDRKCTNRDGCSLEPHDNFVIPHKMAVVIPVFAIHRDPKYWPNPNEFDPERFSAENFDKIVPFSFLPMGDGPRNCIGSRFGMLQMKVGLINFLKNHFVTPTENTPREVQFEPKALVIQSKDDIVLNVVRDPLF